MKLTPPFALSTIGQGFGKNAVNYESVDGTIGHPGIDFTQAWGTPIPCAIDGAVVSCLLDKDNVNLMAFRAVNTIYEDATGCYEIQYGHVSAMAPIKVGQVLKAGDIVGNIGNTGAVFAGTPPVEVTATQKNAGSHAGSHLHFQVRVIQKVPASQPNVAGAHYLNDGVGQLLLNGYKYLIPNFNNGYDGCVDPTPFFTAPAIVIPDSTIPDTVKAEVAVLNKTTDPLVRQSFIALIVAQLRAFLGW